jgi:hypothetical protein
MAPGKVCASMAVRLIQMILFTACVTVLWAAGLAAWKTSAWAACSKSAAWERAKASVRGVLIAPGAAEFPDLAQVRLSRSGDCRWTVEGYVDAVNLHGAFLRADFQLLVGDEVRIETLTTRPAVIELSDAGG